MAELVEYKMGRTIRELEMLEKSNLFCNSELRTIANTLKEFDDRIQRRTASKDDFLGYIQFELDLLNIIETRRKNRGMPSKISGTEYLIVSQVNNIFSQAGHRFPDDLKLSMSHFKFCDKMGLNGRNVLARILQVHGSKSPEYWKFAAQYEMEKRDSLENARQYILRGLKFHPESSILYEQAFLLELMYASRMTEEKIKTDENLVAKNGPERLSLGLSSPPDVNRPLLLEGATGVIAQLGSISSDEVVDGKLALLMYDLGVSKLKDVRFLINCLSISKEFNLTMNIQEKIVNDLVNNYHNEELTWDTMARRELEGLSYSPVDPEHMPSISASAMPNTLFAVEADCPSVSSPSKQTLVGAKIRKKTKVSVRDRIRRCCVVYDAGVKKLDTERMWALYIECLLELLGNGTGGLERFGNAGEGGNASLATSQPNSCPRYTRKLLLKAFRGAHNACKMTEKYYLMWVDILLGENSPNAALAMLSSRMKLKGNKGKSSLCLKGKKRQERKRVTKLNKKVARILAEATDHLPQSSELWMTRLKHHISCSSTATGSMIQAVSKVEEAPRKGDKRRENKEQSGNVSAVASGDQSSSVTSRTVPILETIFSKACSQLGGSQDAVPIWKVMLHYSQAQSDSARVESLFQDAIKREPAISLVFKPLYIEWLVLSQGINAARKAYDQIYSLPPLCLELHTMMAKLEGMQPKVNVKQARKCYEIACEQFGKFSTDVWLEYVKFELLKGSRENATPLYKRAVDSLDNVQANIFMSEFLKMAMRPALDSNLVSSNDCDDSIPSGSIPASLS
ncbi:hypothetical protein J437_LFUL002939 [Ladona fulva]|uniref:Uncharacterized protein n=1 Tax=Ladona fulva TaxID=123851 RepID=A0A8K0KAS0_LADFU|nr:hypothetical protein J437_LFUL002939 [Ladona fulva]